MSDSFDSFYMKVAEHVRGVLEESLEGALPMPRLTVGGSADMAPFDVLVREAPANVEFSDSTSSHAVMGRAAYAGSCVCQFDVNVEMLATRATEAPTLGHAPSVLPGQRPSGCQVNALS